MAIKYKRNQPNKNIIITFKSIIPHAMYNSTYTQCKGGCKKTYIDASPIGVLFALFALFDKPSLNLSYIVHKNKKVYILHAAKYRIYYFNQSKLCVKICSVYKTT